MSDWQQEGDAGVMDEPAGMDDEPGTPEGDPSAEEPGMGGMEDEDTGGGEAS
jgi:hypothetical protein